QNDAGCQQRGERVSDGNQLQRGRDGHPEVLARALRAASEGPGLSGMDVPRSLPGGWPLPGRTCKGGNIGAPSTGIEAVSAVLAAGSTLLVAVDGRRGTGHPDR